MKFGAVPENMQSLSIIPFFRIINVVMLAQLDRWIQENQDKFCVAVGNPTEGTGNEPDGRWAGTTV